jgi:hypothetical protein
MIDDIDDDGDDDDVIDDDDEDDDDDDECRLICSSVYSAPSFPSIRIYLTLV